ARAVSAAVPGLKPASTRSGANPGSATPPTPRATAEGTARASIRRMSADIALRRKVPIATPPDADTFSRTAAVPAESRGSLQLQAPMMFLPSVKLKRGSVLLNARLALHLGERAVAPCAGASAHSKLG